MLIVTAKIPTHANEMTRIVMSPNNDTQQLPFQHILNVKDVGVPSVNELLPSYLLTVISL